MSQDHSRPEPPPSAQMLQMITAQWVSQSVGTAARLGIADQIAGQPRSAEEVARAVGASADAVHRLMRRLASIGVFRQQGDRFELTPLGETLRSSVEGSVRDFAISETDQGHWQPWGRMYDAVKTGRPVAREALGMEEWEWYGQNPKDAVAFSSAMGNLARMVASELPQLIDTSRIQKVADTDAAQG